MPRFFNNMLNEDGYPEAEPTDEDDSEPETRNQQDEQTEDVEF